MSSSTTQYVKITPASRKIRLLRARQLITGGHLTGQFRFSPTLALGKSRGHISHVGCSPARVANKAKSQPRRSSTYAEPQKLG